MRIVLNSPDGVGDFIMRMPMLQSLLAAGHEVLVLARKSTAPLVRVLFPEVGVHVFREDPYDQELKRHRRPFRADLAAVRAFAPDFYLAGAFFLTFFDEEWMARGDKSVPVAGFQAEESRWGSNTIADPHEICRKFSLRIAVPVALPEGEKYLRMAAAVLGRPVTPERPRLPGAAVLSEAAQLMAEAGLEKGRFITVCVGSRPGLKLKDWGEENWKEFLSGVAAESPETLVFLGNRDEAASVDRIRSHLPPGVRHVNFSEEPPSLSVSYALVSLSAGYLGRDGGVMHMAAAAGRPLFAIFGGVHWPRFLPSTGTAVTRSVPCRGCNRFCPFEEPHCIRSISVREALNEWHRWRSGGRSGVVELPCDERLACRIEAAEPLAAAWQRQLEQRRGWRQARPESLWDAMVNALRRSASIGQTGIIA